MKSKDIPGSPSEILARVERRLKALRLTASAASKLAEKPDAINNLRRAAKKTEGRQGVSTATITALAPALQTTPGWLITGIGEENASKKVPLVGYVGAGAQAHRFSDGQGPFEDVDAPEGANPKTVAVEIRGESLGVLFDRWLVFYDETFEEPMSWMLGRLCVVGLPDGRVLVKQLKRGQLDGYYNLLSNTEPPIYDVEVDWAAVVRQMTPK